jgi:methionyl-tRNA formyltransferase
MSAKDLRIVFMGTPDLAAHCLMALSKAGYMVVAAITAPDKPAGRGQKLSQSAVKQTSVELGIPILQPENLKSSDFLNALRELKPDIQVVVAFRMLPEVVWSMPQLGTFNMHASLLPDYRGAAPINWVIINGEKETGVTTFLLNHQIDTGKVLFREIIPIDPQETAGSLHEKLKEPAANIVIKTIDALATNGAAPIEQESLLVDGQLLHPAPKLFREHGRIPWHARGQNIIQLIRGLNPLPGAFCELAADDGSMLQLKIFEASFQAAEHGYIPGKMSSDHKDAVWFACNDGFVQAHQLQLPGKKAMDTPSLLRGFRFRQAEYFRP